MHPKTYYVEVKEDVFLLTICLLCTMHTWLIKQGANRDPNCNIWQLVIFVPNCTFIYQNNFYIHYTKVSSPISNTEGKETMKWMLPLLLFWAKIIWKSLLHSNWKNQWQMLMKDSSLVPVTRSPIHKRICAKKSLPYNGADNILMKSPSSRKKIFVLHVLSSCRSQSR